MKKRVKGRKLNRVASQRKALLKSLARALFLNGKIKTTEAKAKELSGYAEKMITRAKKGDLAARRFFLKTQSKKIAKKLIEEIGPKYKDRAGGYTRVIKTVPRKSDAAKMAIIELV